MFTTAIKREPSNETVSNCDADFFNLIFGFVPLIVTVFRSLIK